MPMTGSLSIKAQTPTPIIENMNDSFEERGFRGPLISINRGSGAVHTSTTSTTSRSSRHSFSTSLLFPAVELSREFLQLTHCISHSILQRKRSSVCWVELPPRVSYHTVIHFIFFLLVVLAWALKVTYVLMNKQLAFSQFYQNSLF